MSDLYASVEHVSDAESFSRFVRALRLEAEQNAEENGPFQSENYNIGDILDSIEGWATTQTGQATFSNANPWQLVARTLLAGHYHE